MFLRPHRPHPSRVPPAGGSALDLILRPLSACLSATLGTRSRSPATLRQCVGGVPISYPSWVWVTLPGCSWDFVYPDFPRIPLHGKLALPGGGEVGPRRQNQGRRGAAGQMVWVGTRWDPPTTPPPLSRKRADCRVGDHRSLWAPHF